MWNQQNTQATFANNMQALQNGLLTPQQWQLVQAMGGNINWQTIADMLNLNAAQQRPRQPYRWTWQRILGLVVLVIILAFLIYGVINLFNKNTAGGQTYKFPVTLNGTVEVAVGDISATAGAKFTPGSVKLGNPTQSTEQSAPTGGSGKVDDSGLE